MQLCWDCFLPKNLGLLTQSFLQRGLHRVTAVTKQLGQWLCKFSFPFFFFLSTTHSNPIRTRIFSTPPFPASKRKSVDRRRSGPRCSSCQYREAVLICAQSCSFHMTWAGGHLETGDTWRTERMNTTVSGTSVTLVFTYEKEIASSNGNRTWRKFSASAGDCDRRCHLELMNNAQATGNSQ